MQLKLAFALIGLLVLLSTADAQNRGRGRNRQRNRGRGPNCHLKEVEQCVNNMDKYSKDPEKSSKLITTSKGLDEICSTSLDSVGCMKGYMKKCGTPLQRELFDFGTEQFTKSVDQFCKPGQARTDFLANSPCIQSKVLSQPEYKEKCVNPFLASLDKTNKLDNLDDRLDIVCCAYNQWEDCTYSLIEKECGKAGSDAMTNFITKAFGGISDMVCNDKTFNPKSNQCRKLFPPAGTVPKGKYSDNPVTKYVASFFGFLFN